MDERQLNMIASIFCSVGVLMIFMTLYNLLVMASPEFYSFIHQCELPNAECVIDPSPLVMVFGLPAPIVFFFMLSWLEKKRLKNWRSYD